MCAAFPDIRKTVNIFRAYFTGDCTVRSVHSSYRFFRYRPVVTCMLRHFQWQLAEASLFHISLHKEVCLWCSFRSSGSRVLDRFWDYLSALFHRGFTTSDKIDDTYRGIWQEMARDKFQKYWNLPQEAEKDNRNSSVPLIWL